MKVAIIGAGFTGLTAAYELAKAGRKVTVFEKENFAGGLASGVRGAVDNYPSDWEWDLERFYHHFFTNDNYVKRFVKEIGQEKKLITKRPITSILYQGSIYQFDSPFNVLTFPHFSWLEKMRLGLSLAELKFIPRWEHLEGISAHEWWIKKIGQHAYSILWEPLLKGKFAEYYQQVNAAWFWARIKKRTPRLMYYQGGFDQLAEELLSAIQVLGGEVRLSQTLTSLPTGFDKIIVTTSPSVFAQLAPKLPHNYQAKLKASISIGALCLILVLEQPLLNRVYWLNVNDGEYPFVFVIEHTNFISPKYYGGRHIVYVGSYFHPGHPEMSVNKELLLDRYLPYLKKLNPKLSRNSILVSWLFREPFAQPIVGLNHSAKLLPIETPLPNVYLATMSQVYPWDRGVNYAIELGRRVAQEI